MFCVPVPIEVYFTWFILFLKDRFQGISQPLEMKGLFLVEPVVALYAFSSFLIFPLVQQYVYRRLWQDVTNTTYPISDNTSRCAANNSSNHSSYHEVSNKILDVWKNMY